MSGLRAWAATYRTPVWLGGVFVALMVVLAVIPDAPRVGAEGLEQLDEPTPGPRECVVCPIDHRCDPGSGRCIPVDHTPLPCVPTAKFDSEAGFCLPEGVPPPPTPVATPDPEPREPRSPGGIGGSGGRIPRAPGIGGN